MNTKEIQQFLKSKCNGVFQGVFSADTLPDNPSLLVCNTDESNKPGQHWVAIHLDDYGRGEYFDSFGRAPNEHFKSYMNEHCRIWTFNNKQLQNIFSRYCGNYCCVYCVLRCRRISMTRIVNMFTNDTAYNDTIAHRFVCNKGL